MVQVSRRTFLKAAVGAAVCSHKGPFATARELASAAVTFSFGTYGMKSLPVEQALRTIADVGYDGVEIAVMPEWDSAPSKLSDERRGAVRRLLSDLDLRLTALMEHLPPSRDDADHRAAVDRLRQAVDLGRALAPESPPLVQTVLGGGRWDEMKSIYRDRLGDWLERVFKPAQVTLAIKPHRGGAMSRPEEAIWLIEQLGRPPLLRIVYDYSHYAFRDMPLEQTVETALPWTAHIAVKDAIEQDGKVAFALPGESRTFDYARLFTLLREGGYAGDVCCEVSGMVWNRPGYDPAAAAKTCYANLAPALQQAGLRRPGL